MAVLQEVKLTEAICTNKASQGLLSAKLAEWALVTLQSHITSQNSVKTKVDKRKVVYIDQGSDVRGVAPVESCLSL